MADKLTHEAVKYERPSKYPAKHCGNCEHVRETAGGNHCSIVKDPIYLEGWCDRWEKK